MKRKFLLALFFIPLSISIGFTLFVISVLLFAHRPTVSTYFHEQETPTAKYLKPVNLSQTTSGLAPIDYVYVINLQRRIEKWEKVKQICEQYGLHPNRIDAVDGRFLSEESKKELIGPYSSTLYAGEIGCILSHLSAIKDGYERGAKIIWVLEDDVQMDGGIRKIPNLLLELAKIDPAWDVFYTDSDHKVSKWAFVNQTRNFFKNRIDPRPDQKLKRLAYYLDTSALNEKIRKCGLRYGAHSMIISRQGMEKILNYFTHVYLWTPYDLDIHYVPDIREYCSIESIVSQQVNKIHDTRKTFSILKANLRRFCKTILQLWDDYWDQR